MFQGVGLPEIKFDQTISIVSYYMMHGISDMFTGEAIRASAEQVQMEIVMGTPFVQLPFQKLVTWTTKTWLNMMCKNLGSLDI